jgi:drug/metabolite transporter (DMT)-like permease
MGVSFAVLGAGLLHAGWNALLKSSAGGDPLLDTATVVAGSTACSLLALPFVPLPRVESWPFALTSVVIHFGYYQTLLGILLISTGLVGIAFAQRHRHPRAATAWALANAAIIAVYTLVDGAGARASGSAWSYVLWLTFVEGIVFLAWIGSRYRGRAPAYIGAQWQRGLLGGFCSVAAYGIVLWAMTRAPVAAVAALRETSVLFAAIIGTVLLKEGFGYARLTGALCVVAGVAALKLA